jgi:hypothetical protein
MIASKTPEWRPSAPIGLPQYPDKHREVPDPLGTVEGVPNSLVDGVPGDAKR